MNTLFSELSTVRLLLRKLRKDDLVDYFRFTSDPEVTKYMLFQPHRDLNASAASIEKALLRYEESDFFRWGIVRKDTGRLIGMIDLLRFREADKSCNFAYMLAQDQWGQGYGSEALAAVVDFGFSQLQLDRIEADHMVPNCASGAIMRKIGMKYTKTIPNAYEKDGISYDAVQYSITRQQWLHGSR